VVLKKVVAKKVAARKAVARAKAVPGTTAPRKAPAAKVAPKQKAVGPAAAKPRSRGTEAPRMRPAAVLRERRTWDESVIPGPPSSLDLDRTASAARSGRREMLERYDQHTETSPALTGGDIDANWESAYSVGDEAPGGDNPTPDQDLVDDIGEAVGLVYEDNEELEGETKVADRDKHRWELDPASSDDFDDR
jgi:hypothetical protein